LLYPIELRPPRSLYTRFGRASARIPCMTDGHTWTCVFYVFVCFVASAPFLLMLHYWHEARTRGWSWTSQDSRDMYVDAAKTIITASGIAVALLASSSISPARTGSSLVAFSAKVVVVCLISSVCFSLIVILALLRGHERAQSRHIEQQRQEGIDRR
jgi:hypothetical protein